MKTKSKLLFEICLTGAFALIADITFCRCNLVAYPVPERTKIIDNTKIEEEVVEIIEEPEPEPEPEKELTLLVYMAADNDLESHALRNLKEMEHACFDNMNVLVLLDRCDAYDETNDNWTDTRLFEVLHDDTNGSTIVSKRLDCPPLGIVMVSVCQQRKMVIPIWGECLLSEIKVVSGENSLISMKMEALKLM